MILHPDSASSRRSVSTSPPGRGRRARPKVQLNADYLRQLQESGQVTQRDEQALQTLEVMTVASADQLARLYWPSHDSASHRLRQLYDRYLIDRAEYQSDRMRDLQLLPSLVYTLGRAGVKWLNLLDGRKRRYGLLPRHIILHNLVVTEIMVLFTESARRMPQLSLDWLGEARVRVTEPVKNQATKRKVVLEPDGMVRFKYGADITHRFFVECDLGTESHRAFDRKVKRYQEYFQSGHWRQFGLDQFPRILTVTTSKTRVANLVDTIRQANSPVFWLVTDFATLRATPLESPWHGARAGKTGHLKGLQPYLNNGADR